MAHARAIGVVVVSALALCACTGSVGETNAPGSGASAASSTASAGPSTGAGGMSASSSAGGGGAPADAGTGAGPVDPCGDALFCEKFDDYAGVTTIDDNQQLGPWHAALNASGAAMDLDGTHAVSGSSALHVHIDAAVTAGGRLFADGGQPIFAGTPTHLYGRMMMYIDPNGTSVHWTFFGVDGDAEPSSPVTGRHASYILSSLPKAGVNTYSFVYGLEAQGADPYHDCWDQGSASMPTATWSCISFEVDSVARKLRMYLDGAVDPIVTVDETGQGCVGNVPGDSPWYGPAITQLFVGGWSFHDMDAPLDVWIDDVVVDTKPLACPAP